MQQAALLEVLLAKGALAYLSLSVQAGVDVLGGYLSPVNDSYGKPGLLAAEHRLRMCELAANAAPYVMVDRCALDGRRHF